VQKQAVEATIDTLPQNITRGTDKYHAKPQLLVFWPRFEPRISRTVRVKHPTAAALGFEYMEIWHFLTILEI
jgi:hypothetical protein